MSGSRDSQTEQRLDEVSTHLDELLASLCEAGLKLESANHEENVTLIAELESVNRDAYLRLVNAVANNKLDIKSHSQLKKSLTDIEKTLADQQDPNRHLKMTGLALLKKYIQLEYTVDDLPKLTSCLEKTADLITEPSKESIDSYKQLINDVLKLKHSCDWAETIHKSMLAALVAASREELLTLYKAGLRLLQELVATTNIKLDIDSTINDLTVFEAQLKKNLTTIYHYTFANDRDPNYRLKIAGIEQLKNVLQAEYILDDLPQLTKKLHATADVIKTETTSRTKLFTRFVDKIKPQDIYRSAIGIFKHLQFTLLHVVEGNFPPDNEAARVYQKLEGGRLYIIYPPGKDNVDYKTKKSDATKTLNDILDYAHEDLAKKFSLQELRQAKKIAVLCESNTPVNQDLDDDLITAFAELCEHDEVKQYIKVDLDEGVSATEVSINRKYNETDSGHYCLEAIRRDLTSEEAPKEKIEITQEMLDQHNDYYTEYQLGLLERKLKTIEKPTVLSTTTTPSQEDLAIIKLPVSGHIGSKADDCTIGIDTFKAELKKHSKDRHLEVIVKNNSANKLNLRIYTNKPSIAVFSNMGIKQQADERGLLYYPIEILRQDKSLAPEPTDPLLGIKINDKSGQKKSIDVTHLFNTDEIRHFIKQGENTPILNTAIAATTSTAPHPGDPILAAMQKINDYLTKRATATNSVLTYFFNSYTGNDYYNRRDNWLKILKEFNKCSNGEINKVHLLYIIDREANIFNVGFSKDYYKHLTELKEVIANSPGLNLDNSLKQKIHSYHQMYAHMKMYTASTLHYMQRDAAIGEQNSGKRNTLLKNEINLVAREKLLYEAQYNLLDANDKKHFLNAKKEHMSEYHNLDNLGHSTSPQLRRK